jgi:hypothetical protein
MKALPLILSVLICIQTTGQSINAQKDEALVRPGGSQLLTAWMDVHLKAIRICKVPSHHERQLAYTGVALYESLVAGTPLYQSLAGQLNGYTNTPAPMENKEICWPASANAAIATMLRYFYSEPPTLKRIDSMEQASKNLFISQGYSEPEINAGAEYGNKVAMSVIEWSTDDGDDKASGPYEVPSGDGLWEPTPPAFIPPIIPYAGNCRTMVKGSIDNTLPPPPVAFSQESGSDFYKMVDEVYQSSLQKDGSKTTIALNWDDFPNGMTLTGGGHWESILRTVMSRMNLSLMEGSRIFAGLFITVRDAAIGCFKAKYTYNMMRPVTYVHKYMNKKDWNPLIVTPPHPEYPAAHATISMSAATILTHMLGDNIGFTDNTYRYRNYPERHYANFREAGREAGMSRFYGGIHYKPSVEAGYKQGEQIADNIANTLVFRKSLTEK